MTHLFPFSISTCSYFSSFTYKSPYINLIRLRFLPHALNSFFEFYSILSNLVSSHLRPIFPIYSSVLSSPFFLLPFLPSLLLPHTYSHSNHPLYPVSSPYLPSHTTGPLSIPRPQLQCREVPAGTRTWKPLFLWESSSCRYLIFTRSLLSCAIWCERHLFRFKDILFLLFPSSVHFIFQFITCFDLIPHTAKYPRSINVLSLFLSSFVAVCDAQGHSLGPETIRSGRNLDTAVDSIINNFHHENDYFKVSECVHMSVWCVHRQSNQSNYHANRSH